MVTPTPIRYTALLLLTAFFHTHAFQMQPSPQRYSSLSSSLQMASTTNNAAFEFQEMRAQLDAMKRDKIPARDLPLDKRQELEQYVQTVVQNRPSPVALKDVGQVLPETRWTLGFSTEAATLGDLPRDAEVNLEFLDESKMDYVLEFSKKTLGLNRLTAKSSYTVDSSQVNPGLVTFVYDDITTDVFGLQNLGVGFFGLLKGRANYVESAYMDGRFWIERGTSPEGQVYYNVYVRYDDDADMDEWGR